MGLAILMIVLITIIIPYGLLLPPSKVTKVASIPVPSKPKSFTGTGADKEITDFDKDLSEVELDDL